MKEHTEDSNELHDYREIEVDGNQTPVRIDKFLMERVDRISRNRVQLAIRAGAIKVNDKTIKPNYKVRPNDFVTIVLPRRPKNSNEIVPQDIPIDVRYEDDDVLVLYKRPGMVVHPGVGHRKYTLVNALAHYYRDLPVLNKENPDRPGLVHRIDKNTSGLMVVAKNQYAMDHLAKQFYYHTIERKYQAIIWGEFHDEEGTIRANVGRDPKNRTNMTVFSDEENTGKWAVTHWKTLERLYYVSLIECQLETGRTHQIRVHMKSQGHPLFSDMKYGGTRIMKGTVHRRYRAFVMKCMDICPRQCLHAKSLAFEHPSSGKWMTFESDLPQDMERCLAQWRKYVKHKKELMNRG